MRQSAGLCQAFGLVGALPGQHLQPHASLPFAYIPSFKEGLRGFTLDAKRHRAYFSTTSRRLGCLDLETDKVLWEQTYSAGCDRSSVSADGQHIYVPTGWWYAAPDSGLMVMDAADGKLLRRIPVGLQAHNSLVSLDGRWLFLGTETMLTMFDAHSQKVALQVKEVGEAGVFPFTIDSRNRYAYVCCQGFGAPNRCAPGGA